MMNNKTIIINNSSLSLEKLTRYMQVEMPQLDLIGSFNTIKDGLNLIYKENPKLVFVNIQHLDTEKFLQLQQMRNTTCSILFLTSDLIEENLKHMSKPILNIKKARKKSIRLKIENAYERVKFDDIIRLEGQSNYTLLYLKHKRRPVLASKTLKWYSNQLDDTQFIRLHRSHVVNRNFIKKVIAKNEKYVVLKDGTRIKVARRKAKCVELLYK